MKAYVLCTNLYSNTHRGAKALKHHLCSCEAVGVSICSVMLYGKFFCQNVLK